MSPFQRGIGSFFKSYGLKKVCTTPPLREDKGGCFEVLFPKKNWDLKNAKKQDHTIPFIVFIP